MSITYLTMTNSFLLDDSNWVPQSHNNVIARQASQDSDYTPVLPMTEVPLHGTHACTPALRRCQGAY